MHFINIFLYDLEYEDTKENIGRNDFATLFDKNN
jgi:uncharacterized protein YjbK